MATEDMNHAERGARVVGELLKVWPAKEAPVLTHIAFCEELQRAIAPYTVGDDRHAKWFRQLDRELVQRLKALRQLAASLLREANKAKGRVNSLADQAPAELRRVLRQARR